MIKMLDSVETLKYTLEYFDPMNNMNNYKDVYNIHSEGAIIYTRYMDKGSEEKKGEATTETIHTLFETILTIVDQADQDEVPIDDYAAEIELSTKNSSMRFSRGLGTKETHLSRIVTEFLKEAGFNEAKE